jgi:hypothetical protein
MNSYANTQGNGRNDFDISPLETATTIFNSRELQRSKACEALAATILKQWKDIRDLVRRYSMNIEIVDP